jgi:YD repeat-containing protein
MIVRLLAFWALFVVCTSQATAQSYDYDERGRLIRATYSDCSTIRYFYDASGNRTERIVLAGDGSCAGNQAPVAADDAITMAPGLRLCLIFSPPMDQALRMAILITTTSGSSRSSKAISLQTMANLAYSSRMTAGRCRSSHRALRVRMRFPMKLKMFLG